MVLDTMVFTYAFFGEGRENLDSREILSSIDRIIVPDLFFSEFANTAWQWIMFKNTPEHVAIEAFYDVNSIITQALEAKTVIESALSLSIDKEHSVYDSIFVATAKEYDTKVISYDKKLLRAFPEYSIHPRVFLRKIN